MRYARAAARLLAGCALALGFPGAALSQSGADALVTGSYRETGWDGYEDNTTFTCRGYPTCVGTYSSTVRGEHCPNTYTYTFGGDLVISGLDLSRSGSIGGTYTITPGFIEPAYLPDGSCVAGQGSASETMHYAGSWNATTGTGSASVLGIDATVSFRADVNAPPPVFPMVVRSRIDARTATASADILYRSQDVGTTGSVYVFAVAPSGQVKGGQEAKAVRVGLAKAAAGEKADACVIAQLSPTTGQLVAVTAAQMQAFLSGTLSAQGASVTILDNVATPSVAGATFYVGYGASGSAMLGNGVFRNAVLVPGSGVCPMLPSQTALWWNPAESGWGLNLNHQGSIVFGTLFTYDERGVPLWLVMSNGAMQSDGVTYSGALQRTKGPAFNADPFTPLGAGDVSTIGSMSVKFVDANSATLEYDVGGVQVRKSIQRQVYGTRAANCLPTTASRATATNYQDLWWNPAESGWGINITHQDNTLFATLFTYDATGRELWLVMSDGRRQADGSYLGDLYRTKGPAFNAVPFTPLTAADVTTVGTMRLAFSDGNNGTLTYTYSGSTVTKAITRQVFSTPVPLCN
jgi:hypothetical protein